MRFIWYSTAPHIGVGYGVVAKELTDRFLKEGHQFKIATKYHQGTTLIVNGIEVFDGSELGLIEEVARTEDYPYIISFNDAWTFAKQDTYFETEKWVSTLMMDTEFIHPTMIKALKKSKYQIACTEHGMRELKRTGFNPYYCPVGVNTNVFKPDIEKRNAFRKKKQWSDDTFVIGALGVNYGTDRKNFIGTLKAFQKFHTKHPDSILYMHTDSMGSLNSGLPLKWVGESCGFPQDESGAVKWVNQKDYHLYQLSQEEIVATYNGIDVLCFPSKGEGAGLPLMEAQSCGTPVIMTATTSGPELLKGGWLIPVDDDDYEFSTLLTWYANVRPSKIEEYLEKAYQAWKDGSIKEEQVKAREGMLAYDWDLVYQKYWSPMLKDLEDKLTEEKLGLTAGDFPDWSVVYKNLEGRLLYFGNNCADAFGCFTKCEAADFPNLLGEVTEDRNFLSRIYPLLPSKDGFKVAKNCYYHSCVGPRFIEEAQKMWDYLQNYPKVRKQVLDFSENANWGDLLYLDDIQKYPEFRKDYANILQKCYVTGFQLTEERLNFLKGGGKDLIDVGCGDCRRFEDYKKAGLSPMGVDINPEWEKLPDVVITDARKLPFDDNFFDSCISIDVLEHIENPMEAFKEMLRVTKNKLLITVTPNYDKTLWEDPTHVVFWSIERWAREFKELAKVVKRENGTFYIEKEEVKKSD